MNPRDAETIIGAEVSRKQQELDALKVSLSVLNETYKPDMTALVEAQAEADIERNKAVVKEVSIAALEQEKSTLEGMIAENEATIASLTAEKADLQIQLESVTAEKESLQTQIETFKPDEITPTEPLEEINP